MARRQGDVGVGQLEQCRTEGCIVDPQQAAEPFGGRRRQRQVGAKVPGEAPLGEPGPRSAGNAIVGIDRLNDQAGAPHRLERHRVVAIDQHHLWRLLTTGEEPQLVAAVPLDRAVPGEVIGVERRQHADRGRMVRIGGHVGRHLDHRRHARRGI